MKQETQNKEETTTAFPLSLPGCHYATGPPSLLQKMFICDLHDYDLHD